jgi:hypothetical protein
MDAGSVWTNRIRAELAQFFSVFRLATSVTMSWGTRPPADQAAVLTPTQIDEGAVDLLRTTAGLRPDDRALIGIIIKALARRRLGASGTNS